MLRLDRRTALLMGLAAAACATEPPASSEPQTSRHVIEALQSADPARLAWATRELRRNTGGYQPIVFPHFARLLWSQGAHDDALRWRSFGGFRLQVDLAYLQENGATNEAMDKARNAAVYLDEQTPLAVTAAHAALPVATRLALLRRALAKDRRTPRLYGYTWMVRDEVLALDDDWTETPADWNVAAMAKLAEVQAKTFGLMSGIEQMQG